MKMAGGIRTGGMDSVKRLRFPVLMSRCLFCVAARFGDASDALHRCSGLAETLVVGLVGQRKIRHGVHRLIINN